MSQPRPSNSVRLWLALIIAAIIFVFAFNLPTIIAYLSYSSQLGEARAAREQLADGTDLTHAFEVVAKALRPSVVSVNSVRRVPMNNDFSGGFFGQHPQGEAIQRGLGSGVLVSKDGYILTNNHVVAGADEVDVVLSDDRDLRARVIGVDEKSDIAVIKIAGDNYAAAPLGDSDKAEVGQWVLAVGSPFGLRQTVTAGIVSATGRANVGIADYEDFLQTDAAINPGNSGGPLVNLQGEVIGVNTAIASETGGNLGVGFAIPSNMARKIMESIIEKGRVERGWLGVAIQDLTTELAQSFGYSGTGALVGDVVDGGPAENAGIRTGDIIVEFNGKEVKNSAELRNLVASTTPGTQVDIVVVRDGQKKTVKAKIGSLDDMAASPGPAAAPAAWGMDVQTLTPQLARAAGVPEDQQGVIVTQVVRDSLADRVGIQPGDVIVSVGNSKITSTQDFRQAIASNNATAGLRLQILRDGMRRYVFIRP